MPIDLWLDTPLRVFDVNVQRFQISDVGCFPLTNDNAATYDADLMNHFSQCPITCVMPFYPSYFEFNRHGIYAPTWTEITYENYEHFHDMLLSGHGVDDFGNPYWELQESKGAAWGDGGFVRIARYVGLIRRAYLMEINGWGYIDCYRGEHRRDPRLRDPRREVRGDQLYPESLTVILINIFIRNFFSD